MSDASIDLERLQEFIPFDCLSESHLKEISGQIQVMTLPPARVVHLLERMDALNRAIVITYALNDLWTYHRLARSLVVSVTVDTMEELDAVLASGIPTDRLLVFTGVGTLQPDLLVQLDALGIPAILGTFGEMDQTAQTEGPAVYQALLGAGIDILATDNVAQAVQALETMPDMADR